MAEKAGGSSAASILAESRVQATALQKYLFTPGVPELIATIALLVLGTIVGCAAEDLTFVTSLYLTVQYVTTIGYGDIVPANNGTRVFLSFFILACLVLLAHFMGSMVGQANDYLSSKVQGLLSAADQSQSCMRSKSAKSLAVTSVLFLVMILFGMIFYGASERCSCSYGYQAVAGCDSSSYEACKLTGGYTKDYVETFYMAVITLTTVGLGDFVPMTRAGRWVGIFWMMLGTAVCASWVGSLSAFIFERKHAAKKAVLVPKSESLFKAMDGDADGYLQKAEHHLYVLAMQGLVTPDVLKALEADFASKSAGQPGVPYGSLQSAGQPGADKILI